MSPFCAFEGENKIQEKFIEMSRVGTCNSGNPRVLMGRQAENYSQNLKVFEEEAPRVGPCVSQQVNREKKYRETKTEGAMEDDSRWSKTCLGRMLTEGGDPVQVLQVAPAALTPTHPRNISKKAPWPLL